ncbi:MAG TPA: PepSY-like domain-containing protein [Aquaticitalea sp.]|nr:PepSY-like domain-containing protein [Aquaticitalea sp.]
MKTLSMIALGMLATASISAQDLKTNEIPSNLQTTFTKAYADARDVEWEKRGDSYKVEFEVNNMDHEVWYAANGKTIKTEMEMDKTALPSAITNVINGKYADFKIEDVEMREEGNNKTYKIEIEKGLMKERTLVINANGKIISDRED